MTPRADGTYDLEALEALDVRLFNEQLVSLLQGQSVHLSRFDFTKKRRSFSDTATQLMPGQPIIIEGIHGLNDASCRPDITNGAKFRVYISALTQLNLDDHNRIRTTDARLIRRMVRRPSSSAPARSTARSTCGPTWCAARRRTYSAFRSTPTLCSIRR